MNKTIQLSSDITKALDIIAKKFEGKGIRWVIITSCGLALQGLDFHPKDIDILTDERGLQQINLLLNEFKLELSRHKKSALLDSIISTFVICNCRIEILCNFKVKSAKNKRWYSLNKFLEYTHNTNISETKLPCLTLAKSIELYQLMGRKKDALKVLKIEQYLHQIHNRK